LGEISAIDGYFSRKQINSGTLAERKEVKMALDAQLRIHLPIAHWIDRLLHLINPEEYHEWHSNLPLPEEIMQQWDQDADRATKTVIAQIDTAIEHAVLINRHHAAELEQRSRERISKELRLPNEIHELVKTGHFNNPALLFGTTITDEAKELDKREERNRNAVGTAEIIAAIAGNQQRRSSHREPTPSKTKYTTRGRSADGRDQNSKRQNASRE
jgi:hypothetical protein